MVALAAWVLVLTCMVALEGHTAEMAQRARRARMIMDVIDRPVFAPPNTADEKVAARAIPFPEDAVRVRINVVDGSRHLRLSLLDTNAVIVVPQQPLRVLGLCQCLRKSAKAFWQCLAL